MFFSIVVKSSKIHNNGERRWLLSTGMEAKWNLLYLYNKEKTARSHKDTALFHTQNKAMIISFPFGKHRRFQRYRRDFHLPVVHRIS